MKCPTKTRLSYTDSVRAQAGISNCKQRTILLFTRQRSQNNSVTLLNTIHKLSSKLLSANTPPSSFWEEIQVSSKASGDTVKISVKNILWASPLVPPTVCQQNRELHVPQCLGITATGGFPDFTFSLEHLFPRSNGSTTSSPCMDT